MFHPLKQFGVLFGVFIALFSLYPAVSVEAQTKRRAISIATGGTGGPAYRWGGAMAQVISKHLPDMEATAEATAASVDNCKLLKSGKVDIATSIGDVAYDAFMGIERFKSTGPLPLRTIVNMYSNYMHFVTLAGSGIQSVSDLKGKRVSTGAPGSGAETVTIKILGGFPFFQPPPCIGDRSPERVEPAALARVIPILGRQPPHILETVSIEVGNPGIRRSGQGMH